MGGSTPFLDGKTGVQTNCAEYKCRTAKNVKSGVFSQWKRKSAMAEK